MSIQQAYTTWSATYDLVENPVRDLDQVVTRETLQQLRFRTILELGCGTGKNTALLAQIGEQVQAIDFSAGMLAQAKTKIQADHVTFMTGDIMQPWPCANETVELIVCNLVLEHIADLTFIFSEAQRCLAKQGCFFVCELHPFKQYQGIQANFANAGEQTNIAAFIHHLSDFWQAATQANFTITSFKEWWHQPDQQKPPLLFSFMFQK